MLSVNFSPFPVLETGRLILRNITHADAPALFEMRSNPELLKYLDRPPFLSVEEAMQFIDKSQKMVTQNEGILWVIALKETPERLIGTVGFWRIQKEHYRAETGYILNPLFWKKGIMKEALNATIQYAFTQTALHSIEANIDPANRASAKLLESCGFVQEAYFKENYYFNGIFKDSIIYSLVKRYPQEGIDNP